MLAAKEIAKRNKQSLGQTISALAHQAVSQSTGVHHTSTVSDRLAAYGIHPLPARGGIVSNELIDGLCGAEGI